MKAKIKNAAELLNNLTINGMEYPDAFITACSRYNINGKDEEELSQEYMRISASI